MNEEHSQKDVVPKTKAETTATVSASGTTKKIKTNVRSKQAPITLAPESEDWAEYLVQQAQWMLHTKQAELAQQQSQIAQRQVEVELLRRLLDLVQHQQALPDLEKELAQAQEQITGLQSANEQLQAQWEVANRESLQAVETTARLRTENERLREEFAAEQKARRDEQTEFKEQIEREIKYEVQGFKGQLAGKLKPLFDRKRTTDDHPADAELADYLRSWAQDLTEKLTDAGIVITRDDV